LRKRFPTEFSLPDFSREEWGLFVGGYCVMLKEVALTTTPNIMSGSVVTKLPPWTVLRMTGPAVIDADTGNARRPCVLHLLPYADTEGEDADTSGAIAEGKTSGYITVYDKSTMQAPIRPYGIANMTSPVEVIKETVLTRTGELTQRKTLAESAGGGDGGQKQVIRRVRTGEHIDILGLPIKVGPILRVRARAQEDGKTGWFTVHDRRNNLDYIHLS